MTDKPDLNRLFRLNEPWKPTFQWFSYMVWREPASDVTADGGIDPLGNVIIDDPTAWVAAASKIKARVQATCNMNGANQEPYEMIGYVLMAEIARLRLLLRRSAEDAAKEEGC